MIKSYFWSKEWIGWAWGGLAFLLVSLYAQVYMSVLFNQWYREFYDILASIEKYTIQDFSNSLYYFSKIAIIAVVTGTITNYFARV